MPESETLANFARTGATLAIHLSIHRLADVAEDLTPFYGPTCPAAVVFRATWPDQKILRGTLATIADEMEDGINRTALILVGPALGGETAVRSALYSTDYDRRYRPQSAESPFSSLEEE